MHAVAIWADRGHLNGPGGTPSRVLAAVRCPRIYSHTPTYRHHHAVAWAGPTESYADLGTEAAATAGVPGLAESTDSDPGSDSGPGLDSGSVDATESAVVRAVDKRRLEDNSARSYALDCRG